MIGTRILKIDSEIAQIIEVKVGTCQWQKNISYAEGGHFDLKYLIYFWINFKNSCAYHVANFLIFSKLPQFLQNFVQKLIQNAKNQLKKFGIWKLKWLKSLWALPGLPDHQCQNFKMSLVNLQISRCQNVYVLQPSA